MRTLAWLAGAMLALLAAEGSASADVDELPAPYRTATGEVVDIEPDGENLLLGGWFRRIGRRTGPLVLVDPRTGRIDRRLPEMRSDQRVAAPDGSGGWCTSRPDTGERLGHFSDGRWDPAFDAYLEWATDEVRALERAGDVLYVAGDFDRIAGQGDRPGIAALDARTGALLPWAPPASLAGSRVQQIRVLGDRVYLRGQFKGESPDEPRWVVALDRETGAELPFDVDSNGPVWSLSVAGDRLFAGGDFSEVGGEERAGIAEVDPATGAPLGFKPDFAARARRTSTWTPRAASSTRPGASSTGPTSRSAASWRSTSIRAPSGRGTPGRRARTPRRSTAGRWPSTGTGSS